MDEVSSEIRRMIKVKLEAETTIKMLTEMLDQATEKLRTAERRIDELQGRSVSH